ncbi:proton pump-interactor 2-like isoform X1 [Cucumis melo var. makuwa]|uniref:Proton pump-interactor 2-like isoform X1 n=1 Tax=Cucumis melo var. makuwa TaxID=1194695 RepID=A0A5A7T8N4_CUCMM|nr:proton pump-interactor 2-like isoform X1 [Cucumis melo var. makuwa]
MEEGEFNCREKNMVEEGEGPEVVGEEEIIDCSDDEMPVGVRHFYFVKVLPLENPNLDAMIKKAEERIEKTNRDQVLLATKIREKMMDRDAVRSKLRWMKNYDYYELTIKWQKERLDILHLYLDKLTFANNAYKEKQVNSCLSSGEVDKRVLSIELFLVHFCDALLLICLYVIDLSCEQKLHFLMLHGCKNMADERKLLREVNESQGKDGGITLDELHAPIRRLRQQFPMYFRGESDEDPRKQHEVIIEKAIANAVVNGKLWNSLSSKKSIQEEIEKLKNSSFQLRERQRKTNAEIRKVKLELEKVEKDIRSLQKLFTDANRKKADAYKTILRLKKQYGEENASYYKYRSLMKKVEALVKKKDITEVQELSQKQVGKFMQQWNDNLEFRNDYKKRVNPSLTNRHLGVDGRMMSNQKPEVEDTRKVIKPETLSKARLKWLMKDLEDPFELLS